MFMPIGGVLGLYSVPENCSRYSRLTVCKESLAVFTAQYLCHLGNVKHTCYRINQSSLRLIPVVVNFGEVRNLVWFLISQFFGMKKLWRKSNSKSTPIIPIGAPLTKSSGDLLKQVI